MGEKCEPGPPFRMTLPTQLVLRVLLEHPTQERYGLEIGQAAGLRSGTIHPILARLEVASWLESRWEEVDPAEEGRPRRRYYMLTPRGIELARDALARVRTPVTPLAELRSGLVGGVA